MPSHRAVWYFNNCRTEEHAAEYARGAFFDLYRKQRSHRIAGQIEPGSLCAVLSRRKVEDGMIRVDWHRLDRIREMRPRNGGARASVFVGPLCRSELLVERRAATIDRYKPFFDRLHRIKHGSVFRGEIPLAEWRALSRRTSPRPGRSGRAQREEAEAIREVTLVRGAGFGDLETNRRVERVAIGEVTRRFEEEGWRVNSVERDKRGYDLKCIRGGTERHVEVKGIQGRASVFIVTAGELRRARTDRRFWIAIVTAALSRKPRVEVVPGRELIRGFRHKALAFRCCRKRQRPSH